MYQDENEEKNGSTFDGFVEQVWRMVISIYQDEGEGMNGSNFHGFVGQIWRMAGIYIGTMTKDRMGQISWVCWTNMADGCSTSGRR